MACSVCCRSCRQLLAASQRSLRHFPGGAELPVTSRIVRVSTTHRLQGLVPALAEQAGLKAHTAPLLSIPRLAECWHSTQVQHARGSVRLSRARQITAKTLDDQRGPT